MNALLTAAVAALALAATVASAQPLTLRTASSEALSRNPAIAAADAREQTARARQNEARAGRLPRIDASETVTRGNHPVFVFGSLLEQGEFGPQHFDPAFLNDPGPLTHFRTSITARLPLFDRFRTSTAIRQAGNLVAGAEVETAESRQRILAAVIARFYGVTVAEQKVLTAREAVRSAEADAKAARDRFEQGMLVESDALAADVHLASLRQRLIATEGELAIAQAALATLLQRPAREPLAVEGVLPPGPRDIPDLQAAVKRALEARAPVRNAAAGVANAGLQLRAERAMLLPRVDAFGTLGVSGGTFGDRNTDHLAGIAVTVELFDRGRSSRIVASKAELDAARAAEAQARDAVTMEVITAWHRLNAARESALVAEGAVERAQSAARIVRDRFEHGMTTITEQLRAQTALVSARFDLLATRYESLVAHAELLRATGDLHDVDPLL